MLFYRRMNKWHLWSVSRVCGDIMCFWVCASLTLKHFEHSNETIINCLTLTAHVHFISDAVCFLATALLNDGPEALPALKVRNSHPILTILDICMVPLFVDLMKVISCLSVKLDGGLLILLDPLTGISTGEVGSVGQGRTQPLLTPISWKRGQSSKVKFCVWCLLYTVDYVKLPSPASRALILFRPLNKN